MLAHADHAPFLAKVAARDAEAARKTVVKPSNPQHQTYVSNARWAKPLAKPKKNFIPAQSFLAYNWIDKDPELEFVIYAIAESGMTLEQIETETEKHGHKISRYTLMGWVFGSTKRPQNVTISTVMAVLGWNRPWQKTA